MKKDKKKDMYMGGGYARQMRREGGQSSDYSSIRDMALSCETKTGGVSTKSKPTES
tara:strand:- start:416 stop:583 length:168 start_codon:yes stop_codon:yes gene_type:complete